MMRKNKLINWRLYILTNTAIWGIATCSNDITIYSVLFLFSTVITANFAIKFTFLQAISMANQKEIL
ncbi:hypothetical protein BZZ03_00610 [Lactococcus petauri]|uniref:Uncharacterized protein n=1 Tax=Lactococcus petauri TaxID=1940789 RepID=A0A252CFD3_9LACT|nr:hypothetical protein BZZ03_00610 [Lactococcus petauri]